jgi:glycosyltransferase involved in cell wall biosynthesis
VQVEELDDSFPFPTADAVSHAAATFGKLPNDALVLIDGLAYSAMADVVASESTRLNLIALLHLPLAATVGLDREQIHNVSSVEQLALSHARCVIVTGTHTLTLMKEFGLAHPNVVVVEPGVDPAPLSEGSDSDCVSLVTVAALTTGKGYEHLLDALSTIPHRQFRLTCAGSLTRDPDTAARVCALIKQLRLEEQVTLLGELDQRDVSDAYARADVFVLASLRETYGMAVAEALARGLPVVATATGAVPALVEHGAGIVVPPGDIDALAGALLRMIDDNDVRARCAEGARRVRETLPTWHDAAARLALALNTARHG